MIDGENNHSDRSLHAMLSGDRIKIQLVTLLSEAPHQDTPVLKSIALDSVKTKKQEGQFNSKFKIINSKLYS